jgi:hypothetical protein
VITLNQARQMYDEFTRRRPLLDNSYAERFECLEEERFARCIVADSKYDVVKHEFS